MFQIQRSATHNATDLQNFLKDLNDWEGDIKRKDDKLKSGPKEEGALPPVRGTRKKQKGKQIESNKIDKDVEGQELKRNPLPRDPRAWDKVDVDKMLLEIDQENQAPIAESSSSEDSEEEEMTAIKLKQKAIFEKDRGNQFFKNGRYDKAIECYTSGLQADCNNAILLGNRAMALLKQDKFGAAEADCNAALELDPAYVKALLRRGAARMALNKLEEAKVDFEDVLFLEASNKQAKQELAKVKKLIDKKGFSKKNDVEDKILHPMNVEKVESRWVVPIKKASENVSRKPMRRIMIEEVGITKEELARKKVIEGKTKLRLDKMNENDLRFFKGVEDEGMEVELEMNKANVGRDPKVQVIESKMTKSEEKTKKKVESSSKIEKLKEGNKSQIDNPLQRSRMVQNGKESGYWQSVAEDLDPNRPVNTEKNRATGTMKTGVELEASVTQMKSCYQDTIPPAPTTALQFQTDLNKLLKSESSKALLYLAQISPKNFPKIIKNMLDTDLVMAIINTIKQNQESVEDLHFQVLPYLDALTKTDRFDMAAMFMTKTDRGMVQKVIDYQLQRNLMSQTDADGLLKKFGI